LQSSDRNKKNSLIAEYSDLLGNAVLRHRAQIAERAGRVEAERADRLKSSFLANMSHELRTPLNAIIGFSQILKETDPHPVDPAKIQEYATYINDTAKQLLAIINDVLEISKLQCSEPVLDAQDVLLMEVLRSCDAVVRLAAEKAGVKLVYRIRRDLPMVKGDPVKLKQIFSNLLSNAVKFTPPGGSVHLKADLAGDQQALIVIRDSGCGMTADEIEVALAPFGQVESELNRSYEGTGLGLPIAKALVELHRGTFAIESKRHIGTQVTITLPLTPAENLMAIDHLIQGSKAVA
jgi:two-component system cell cycle sensor histidine kinase PleC